MNKAEKWKWFKDLVVEMRKRNTRLIVEQDGNQVMLTIGLMDLNTDDWIELNPHRTDLRTGLSFVTVGGVSKFIDVKYLLFHYRLKEK